MPNAVATNFFFVKYGIEEKRVGEKIDIKIPFNT